MADENITISLTATTNLDDVIKRLKEFKAELDRTEKSIFNLREQLANFSASSGKSLDLVARKMKETFAKDVMQGITKPIDIPKPDYAAIKTKERTGTIEERKRAIAEEMAMAKAQYTQEKALAKEANDYAKGLIKEYNANLAAALKQQTAYKKAQTAQYKADIKEQEKFEKDLMAHLSDAEKKKVQENIRLEKQRADELKRLAQEELKGRVVSIDWNKLNQDAKAGTQQFRANVDLIKQKMVELSKSTGQSFNIIGKQIIEAAKAQGMSGNQLKVFSSQVATATKELGAAQKGTVAFSGALGKLGTVGSFVFGSVLGITAITIIRDLINYLKQAATAGYDFSKALFQLSAGVNAIRRAGVDITFTDMMTNIKALKKEFPIFSIPELVKGASALINLTRDFGFAKEQIFELQDAILKLAIINGRAMDDVQRTVALAISSGYTEGLQRLSVSINRITIAEKAASLGYADSYMALTELQRAEATRLLILEKTAVYQEDLTEYQKKLPGLIDASTASFADFKAQLGTALLPTWALFMRVLQGGADFLTRVFGETLPKVMKSLVQNFMILAGVAQQAWEIISGKRISIDMDAINRQAKEAADLIRGYFAGEAFTLPEPEVNKGKLKEFTDDQLDAYKDLIKSLTELQDEYNNKYEEAQLDFLADLVKIDKEYNDRRKEIWEDYYKEVDKINESAAQDIADAEQDLQDNIQDLNRDTQKQISDANRKYHENEIKAERDYQEKLRRLREEFLFDLEDALRERDALQVLRLIRRYKLDKEQTTRQYEQEKQDRAEAYRQELEDIRRQATEKLRELQIEHQRRLREIEEQRQRELIEAERKREEELAQAREDWLQKREERTKQYAEELEDLKTWLQTQLDEAVAKYSELNDVTDAMMQTLAQTLQSVLGEGGLANITFDQFNAMLDYAIANAIAKQTELSQILANINSMSASILGGTTPTLNPQGTYLAPNYLNPFPGTTATGGTRPPGGHASGATNMILTRPKLIMAGEVPERVDITPLNQLGSKSGKGQLEIWLGAGLEGKIVDNALGQVEIVLRKELEKH